MTGRQVKAEEALRIGLVDEVVPNDQLHARALEFAASLAKGAVQAQAMVKQAVDTGIETDLAAGLLVERHLFEQAFHTHDSQIGVRSFLEHGPGKAEFTQS